MEAVQVECSEEKEEVTESYQCLELNMKILSTFGLWRPQHIPEDWRARFHTYFYYIIIANSCFQIIHTHLIDIYLNINDFSAVVEDTGHIVTFLNITVKMCGFFFQMRQLDELVVSIRRLHNPEQLQEERQRRIIEDTQRFTYRLQVGLLIAHIITHIVFIFISIPLGLMQRKLQGRGHWAYDATKSPAFELTFLALSVQAQIYIDLAATCDGFLFCALLHLISQFKILNYRLINIRNLAIRNLTTSKMQPVIVAKRPTAGFSNIGNSILKLVKFGKTKIWKDKEENSEKEQIIREESTNTQDNWKVVSGRTIKKLQVVRRSMRGNVKGWKRQNSRLSPITEEIEQISTKTLIRPSKQQDKQEKCEVEGKPISEQDVDREMKKILADCVDHHVELMRTTQQFRSFFSPAMWIQMISYHIISAIHAVFISTIGWSMDTVSRTLLLFALLLEIMLICTLANTITDESERVKDSLFYSDWLKSSESFKNSMRIVMTVANKPIIMTTGIKYVSFTRERLTLVTIEAYRFFTFINTVISKLKRQI